MRTRTYRKALLSTLLLAGCTPRETMPELTDRVFAVAAAQYEQLEGRLTDETLPRSVASDGKFIPSNIRWWCSGFYPGSLWYIYEYTGDKTFRELAEKNTFKLYPLKQMCIRDRNMLRCLTISAYILGSAKAAFPKSVSISRSKSYRWRVIRSTRGFSF